MRTNFDAHKTKIPEDHKRALRDQLLLHADEKLAKPAKLTLLKFWPVVAVPIAALTLFVAVPMLHPAEPQKAPSNVHDTVTSLTPQKLFRLASEQLDQQQQQQLKPGQYFYTKSLESLVFNHKNQPNEGRDYCLYKQSYREMWRNTYGVPVRDSYSTLDGKLYQLNTEVDDNHIDRKPGAEFFADPSLDKANEVRVTCPVVPAPHSNAPSMSIEEYLRSDLYRAQGDIQSVSLARQKEGFAILAKQTGFKLTQNQQINNYSKPIIILQSGDSPYDDTYYFDQETKAYVGMTISDGRSHSIVVERGVKALPTNDPPEYFQPTPFGQ